MERLGFDQSRLPLRLRAHTDTHLIALPRLAMIDLTRSMATSALGLDRIRSLLAYRETLKLLGLTEGFQWVLGPPVAGPTRTPARSARSTDVDIVTFCRRPARAASDPGWQRFVDLNQPLFDPERVWAGFGCRAYFVDLGLAPEAVVAQARFWFEVLARQRHELAVQLIETPLGDTEDAVAATLVPWS